MIRKIISGGQAGADQGGLEAGRDLGLETGGTAPQGWMTEAGPQPNKLKSFGLVEAGVAGYPFRTKMNVLNSDATAVFGFIGEPGSRLTCSLCKKFGKPWVVNPNTADLLELLEWHNVEVLNVAGNRESKSLGIQQKVREFLKQALEEVIADGR